MHRLGRYEIHKELGRGGMGVVYAGIDPAIGRTVAIKTIRLSEQGTPEEAENLRQRLLREARAAGTLSHPNIVAIHDLGQEGDITYIVMEYVKGRTLEQLLAGQAAVPPRERLLEILAGAAAALDHAHAHGIIHRDVKPANIMTGEDGVTKLTDFGIAKLAWAKSMTETGAVVGSAYYLSPEQLKAQDVSGRSDQFSLASIAYTVLTGQRPFQADTVATLFSKILFEEPASPQSINPSLGADVERVLLKGLSKDPADRFASCAEFIDALRAACGEAAAGRKPERVGLLRRLIGARRRAAAGPSSFFRSRWFPALMIGAVLIALAGAVWYISSLMRSRQYETMYWDRIRDSAYVELFDSFLGEFPRGRFAEEARARIRHLRQEMSAWEALGENPSIEALEAFLKAYPGGRFALEAKLKLETLKLERQTAPSQPGPGR